MSDDRAPYTLIRDLPPSDRPRERLRDAGPAALSNAELLAIILRVGGAKQSALSQANSLLARFSGLPGLRSAAFLELCREPGIGEAKAAQIKAALELGVRLSSYNADDRPLVRTPDDIANLVMAEMSLLQQEHVRVMLLDAKNRLLSMQTVYVGSVHTAHVRIAELLSDAVRIRAAAIVVLHNHPSGDPTPSPADVTLTRGIFEASRLLGIDLLDHVIIGGGRYVSMHALKAGFPGAAR
jgi:DNA repair protein RadC